MIYSPLIKKACNLIFEAHKGQLDKGGYPYVMHPIHLAEQMDDELSTIVALLHDVVEDTDVTFEDLTEMGFPKEVIDALTLLTHKKDVPYLEYVSAVKESEIATKVKLADLKHNSDITRIETNDDKSKERITKHKEAIRVLKDE